MVTVTSQTVKPHHPRRAPCQRDLRTAFVAMLSNGGHYHPKRLPFGSRFPCVAVPVPEIHSEPLALAVMSVANCSRKHLASPSSQVFLQDHALLVPREEGVLFSSCRSRQSPVTAIRAFEAVRVSAKCTNSLSMRATPICYESFG